MFVAHSLMQSPAVCQVNLVMALLTVDASWTHSHPDLLMATAVLIAGHTLCIIISSPNLKTAKKVINAELAGKSELS
jgi:hypothetical protein